MEKLNNNNNYNKDSRNVGSIQYKKNSIIEETDFIIFPNFKNIIIMIIYSKLLCSNIKNKSYSNYTKKRKLLQYINNKFNERLNIEQLIHKISCHDKINSVLFTKEQLDAITKNKNMN